MIDIHKIDRIIIRPVKNLALRIHVRLLKEKEGKEENFHNVFSFNDTNYLKLDLQSYLTLEIVRDGEWAKDKSILITERNIFHVIKGFKQCIDAIYNGGIFAVKKGGEIIRYADMAEKNTTRIYNLGNNNRIVLVPSIITDEDEVTYEGVVMYVNRTENCVEMTIDALESLCYALEQTNLFVYSQLLVNYYISALKNEKVELKQVTVGNKAKNKTKNRQDSIFLPPEKKEQVTSNVVKEKTPEEIFNYDNKNKG